MSRTLQDAGLALSRALPNGAATVTSAAGVQVKSDAKAEFHAGTELEISAPALATGVLADAATCKYSVVHGDAADLSDATVLAGDVIVQTGAGGAGDAAKTTRFRLPSTVKKYVGLKIVKSGAGDATGSTATLKFMF